MAFKGQMTQPTYNSTVMWKWVTQNSLLSLCESDKQCQRQAWWLETCCKCNAIQCTILKQTAVHFGAMLKLKYVHRYDGKPWYYMGIWHKNTIPNINTNFLSEFGRQTATWPYGWRQTSQYSIVHHGVKIKWWLNCIAPTQIFNYCINKIILVADRCHDVGMAGCGHSKIARVRTYYLYCMWLAVLTSV